MQLPSLNIKKIPYRVAWLIAILLVIIILSFAIARKRKAGISKIEVNVVRVDGNNALITEEEIYKDVEKSFGNELTSTQLEDIDISRVEQALEQNPSVLDADAYIDAKNHLKVTIHQRKPVLRVIGNRGENFYLDEHAMKVPFSKHYTPRVVVLTGNVPNYTMDLLNQKNNLLKDAFLLNEAISKDAFYNVMIDQIHISNQAEFILVPKVGDQKILFGNVDDKLGDKLIRLKKFYKEAMPASGWNKYSTIDVRFKNQIVCR